jgi:predicted SAM-dependent methyltransferase
LWNVGNMKKLNLGCAQHVVDGWINVDYALGARIFKAPLFSTLNRKLHLFKMEWDRRILIHDLRRRFPFQDGNVDIVYSSHTLEHFTRDDGRRFLEECHRVLRPNGIVRIVVPDLKDFVKQYTSGRMRADEFCEKLMCLPPLSGKGMLSRFFINMFAFPHQCMYDTETLLTILSEIGFRAESRKPFESDIGDIVDIENKDRVAGSVIVEGRKRKRSPC